MRSWISRSCATSSSVARSAARPARCTSRTRAHFVHLLEVERSATKKEAHRLAHGVRVDGCDAQPAAGADIDHALCDESADRLAHDRARDAELLAELTLGREAVADVETIRQDRLEHHVGHLVREPPFAIHQPEERRLRAFEAGDASSPALGHANDHTSYSMPPHLLDGRHAVV